MTRFKNFLGRLLAVDIKWHEEELREQKVSIAQLTDMVNEKRILQSEIEHQILHLDLEN